MRKIPVFLLCYLFFFIKVIAQPITVDSTVNVNILAQSLAGPGVVISNVTGVGALASFANGTAGAGNIGIGQGVLLTTGSLFGAVGPNDVKGKSTILWPGPGGETNALLNGLGQGQTKEASFISFDIVPAGTSISFSYVFGSEEYHEYVNTYNDVLGLFISGPGISGNFNMATLPGSSTPVSINNINNGKTNSHCSTGPGMNVQFFRENCFGTSTQYDGFTTVLQAVSPTLMPCETYTITIAVGDVVDGSYDSGVFISAGSIVSPGDTDFGMNVGCSNGNWSVTTNALDQSVQNNVWELWQTDVPGATTGGTLVNTITGGLNAAFNWLELGQHYYIRHYSIVCEIWETIYPVPDFTANATVSFQIEDEYCVGEDIFLNGIASTNYDRFYLSAGRRPIGSAPGTPFTGYADYGWTIDNSIGILNLSYEFLNNGQNPGEVFEPGYEYQILLAIANPPNCIPWMELKKTFRVVCCDVSPAFNVQASCNNGNWSVSASPVSPLATNHSWQLYEVSSPGATTGGTPVGPAQTTTNATFSGLNQAKYYYIKHTTGYAGCEMQMASLAAPNLQANASLAYVFKDINNTVKNNFCYGEDIYLDPAGTNNYDRFFMAVYRRPITGGNFSYYADYEWTITNNIGLLNLSQLFFSSGQNPGEIFEPGYEYELQFAIANPQNCIPWTELKKRFTVECCNDFFSAAFRYELNQKPGGFEVRVYDFNTYSPYATHEWTVVSSPNANGGPYTLVTQTTTTGPGPHVLYSQGVSGLYYFVIHKVVTLCGEECYTDSKQAVGTEVQQDGPVCDICGPDDCSILEVILC
ncbi:MAG: hypothetical protein HUU01_16435, partial [Saprospiraceae bacterium]|nr:hypothetical protein [Saprospiraceae bacterium]